METNMFNSTLKNSNSLFCSSCSEFRGYTLLCCSEKCSIGFHPSCWRRYKNNHVTISTEKDALFTPCLTPDCPGIISFLGLYDTKNKVIKKVWACFIYFLYTFFNAVWVRYRIFKKKLDGVPFLKLHHVCTRNLLGYNGAQCSIDYAAQMVFDLFLFYLSVHSRSKNFLHMPFQHIIWVKAGWRPSYCCVIDCTLLRTFWKNLLRYYKIFDVCES